MHKQWPQKLVAIMQLDIITKNSAAFTPLESVFRCVKVQRVIVNIKFAIWPESWSTPPTFCAWLSIAQYSYFTTWLLIWFLWWQVTNNYRTVPTSWDSPLKAKSFHASGATICLHMQCDMLSESGVVPIRCSCPLATKWEFERRHNLKESDNM